MNTKTHVRKLLEGDGTFWDRIEDAVNSNEWLHEWFYGTSDGDGAAFAVLKDAAKRNSQEPVRTLLYHKFNALHAHLEDMVHRDDATEDDIALMETVAQIIRDLTTLM